MYRSLLALAVPLALLPGAPAAPVPSDPAAVRKTLDTHWAELEKDEPVASKALLGFVGRPKDAIPYLRENLKPLKLSKDRAKQLLTDLGSERDAVWRAAFHELEYLDPRIVIGLVDLMDQVTESPARQRLVTVLSGRSLEFLDKHLTNRPVTFRAVKQGDGYCFQAEGSWWAEHRIEKLNVGEHVDCPKKKWTRAVRAVAVLEFFGTPDAVAILKDLATGHPDAQPTKVAKEALDRLKDKP